MCEHFVARAAEPFRLDELWPFTERLERFGIAGFGWGAAWLRRRRAAAQPPRPPRVPRRPRRAASGRRRGDDGGPRPPAPAVAAVDARAARHAAVRRPGRSLQPSATTATCATTARCARRTGRQGRIHGRADTEVGARWLEDAWRDDEPGGPPPGRAPRPVRRPGQPRGPDRRRHAAPLRRQQREPRLHVPPRPDRHRVDRDLLARPVAVPVRRAGRDRAPPGPPAHDRDARP